MLRTTGELWTLDSYLRCPTTLRLRGVDVSSSESSHKLLQPLPESPNMNPNNTSPNRPSETPPTMPIVTTARTNRPNFRDTNSYNLRSQPRTHSNEIHDTSADFPASSWEERHAAPNGVSQSSVEQSQHASDVEYRHENVVLVNPTNTGQASTTRQVPASRAQTGQAGSERPVLVSRVQTNQSNTERPISILLRRAQTDQAGNERPILILLRRARTRQARTQPPMLVSRTQAGQADSERPVLVSRAQTDRASTTRPVLDSRAQTRQASTERPALVSRTGTVLNRDEELDYVRRAERGVVQTRRYSEPKFSIEEYRPFFCWKYNTNENLCVICMNDLESFCSDCEISQREPLNPEKDCKITWGKCSHVFHGHCLQKWFQRSNTVTCPLDRQVFEVDKKF